MAQKHIHQQIPDYVLGLLPRHEQKQVEAHTLICQDCRLALRREADLGLLVKSTLTAASQPPANLRQFMPAVPAQKGFWPHFSLSWQQSLVPLTLVLFMLIGSLGFYLSQQRGGLITPNPTALAITATLTDSPTATITETRIEQAFVPVATAVPGNAPQPEITATPAPNPTPIAALNIMRDT
jgi:hypothetical protein